MTRPTTPLFDSGKPELATEVDEMFGNGSHSVKVPEDGGKDWPETIIDRDPGDENDHPTFRINGLGTVKATLVEPDPVIKICRAELDQAGVRRRLRLARS